MYGRLALADLAEAMSRNLRTNLAFLEVDIPLEKFDYTHRDESTNNAAWKNWKWHSSLHDSPMGAAFSERPASQELAAPQTVKREAKK